jgi:hypothetical protein
VVTAQGVAARQPMQHRMIGLTRHGHTHPTIVTTEKRESGGHTHLE